MPWALGRKLMYLAGTALFVSALVGIPLYLIFQEDPSCVDGLQNQDERGIDCGGVCKILCLSEVNDLDILWSRSFKVTDGVYNAVAYIENTNFTATVRDLPYIFELYDNKNVLIAERRGEVTLSTNGATPIFEPAIQTGTRVPERTFFRFTATKRFVATSASKPTIEVEEKTLISPEDHPRVTAELRNNSVDSYRDVEVVAIVYDRSSNAIAASKTEIPVFSPHSSRPVVFTWPAAFSTTTALRIEVIVKIPL
jgi:hypothetical protein